MDIYNNIPYTYLIGWSKLDTWYYGVQYGKKCHPDNLWVKYFTSSKHVKKFRELNGEPDVIEVRHTFNNKEKAQKWEIKCISKLEMVKSSKWLNRKEPGAKWFPTGKMSESHKLAISKANKGRPLSKEHCAKIGEANKRRGSPSKETILKMKESIRIANQKPEVQARRKVAAKNKSPVTEETRRNMSIGHQNRTLRTAETRAKHSEANRRRGPRSIETKEKIRNSFLGTTRPEELNVKTRNTILAAKRRWYTNGEVTLFLGVVEIIPPGFMLGRKLKPT